MKTTKKNPKGLRPSPLRFGGASQDPSGLRRWHDADDLRWAVQHWATRMNVQAPLVQIRLMQRKWASLSTRGRLTLNAELLALPRDLGEYAIVHELVHLLNADPFIKSRRRFQRLGQGRGKVREGV